MGKVDIATKQYMSHRDVIADVFNFYIFDASHGLLRSFAALAILLPFGFADLLRKSLPSSWECRFQAQILFPASRNQSEFGTLEVSNSIF